MKLQCLIRWPLPTKVDKNSYYILLLVVCEASCTFVSNNYSDS